MKKLIIWGFSIIVVSCSNNDPSEAEVLIQSGLSITDPVIAKFSEFGSIEMASASYSPALINCSPPKGVYLFTPDHGPFAGEVSEIYRYALESDISEPCGDEFILDYQENILQGYKYIDCPVDGSTCYTFEGPATCVIVYCDENENG